MAPSATPRSTGDSTAPTPDDGMEIVIECQGAARGVLIGFLVGLTFALLRFGPEQATHYMLPISAPSQPTRRLQPVALPRLSAQTLAMSTPPEAHTTEPVAQKEPVPLQNMAACVGGALSLVVPGLGRSVRLGVLEPLGWPDVFVAGTLNATTKEVADTAHWEARTAAALRGISEVGPFAATSVVRQLTRQELAEQLRGSSAWSEYQRQIGRGGDGRLRPEDDDPRLWLPTMLSPALGNPSGNTLREMVYQSRCYHLLELHEQTVRRGARYKRVLFTRLEYEWIRPHPPLSLLPEALTWIPAGEDNFGLYDRHWLSPRRDASVLMRRWDSLLDGTAVRAVHGGARARPVYVSSEMFLLRTALHGGVAIGRFPMLAYLQCCEEGYRDARGRKIQSEHNGVLSTGDGASVGAKTCFQAHCNKKRCPSAHPVRAEAKDEAGFCRFKYDDEGSAFVAWPKRCLAERAQTPAANASAGCLFPEHAYKSPLLVDAAQRHSCRYFAPTPMRALCDSLTRAGDKPDHRGKTYAEQYFPWWCKGDWEKDKVAMDEAERQWGYDMMRRAAAA